MTVTNQTDKVTGLGNGSARTFSFSPMVIPDRDDLVVTHVDADGVETVLSRGTGANAYAVVVSAYPGTGSVRYPEAGGTLLTSDESIVMKRVLTLEQQTNLENQGGYNAEVLERQLDKLVMIDLQQQESIDRSVTLPISVTGVSAELPIPVANRLVGWNSNADALTNFTPNEETYLDVSAFVKTLLNDVDGEAFLDTLIASATASVALDDLGFTAFTKTLVDDASAAVARATLGGPVIENSTRQGLRDLLLPTQSGGWNSLYQAGWTPAFFNQQWGGAQWGQLPDGSWGDIATGYIERTGYWNIADAAARTYQAQGFKVSEAITVQAIWVRIWKTGNPTNNLQLTIYSDSGGDPDAAITNGTAVAQSGKLHTSTSDGTWVRFTFSTNPSLSADTQYHIVLNSSGAVDGSNYWCWTAKTNWKYPFGNLKSGDATPTWTNQPSWTVTFLVEAEASNQFLQTGGQFDAKLVCAEGNPLNQSKGLVKDLKYSDVDLVEGTILIRGTAFTASKPFFEIAYGSDHDRLVLSVDGSNHLNVGLWENDETYHSITDTTTDITSGYHDVAVAYRVKGDGSDYLKVFVDGAEEGTGLTSQTFTWSDEFVYSRLGTVWLGGAHTTPDDISWDKNLDMSALPSADGDTSWGGAGTEADCMSVSGSKLYQNKNGYGSTDDGVYTISTALNNAVGSIAVAKLKVPSDVNKTSANGVYFSVRDGAKNSAWSPHTYWARGTNLNSNPDIYADFKSIENVISIVTKGSDAFYMLNGRLIIDGTTLLATATATNDIRFGDVDTTAGENSDAVWDYLKYYDTAWLPPEFSSVSIHEFAAWSGDQTAILDELYNSGSPVSVREMANIQRGYAELIERKFEVRGITSGPTTTSTSFTLLAEMEQFILGEEIDGHFSYYGSNSVDGYWTGIMPVIDRATLHSADTRYADSAGAAGNVTIASSFKRRVSTGLHKAEVLWAAQGGTSTSGDIQRALSGIVK